MVYQAQVPDVKRRHFTSTSIQSIAGKTGDALNGGRAVIIRAPLKTPVLGFGRIFYPNNAF